MKSMFREPETVIKVHLANVLKGTVIAKVLNPYLNHHPFVCSLPTPPYHIVICKRGKNKLIAIQIFPNIIKLPFMLNTTLVPA